MRDYNHWTVLGVLCELLPQAENRVKLSRTDAFCRRVRKSSPCESRARASRKIRPIFSAL